MKRIFQAILLGFIGFFALACSGANSSNSTDKSATSDFITLKEQGSFSVGGVVLKSKEGKSYHADHAYVFYQIPANSKAYPMVFVHGFGQFSKTWETTPDGREGFQNIFLKQSYPVYLVDQPRRGNAGKSTQSVSIKPDINDERWFNHFRIGIYPKHFEGVQFPRDEASLNQFYRQMTPTIAKSEDLELYAKTYAALLDKIGGAILITHSQGGRVGWLTALKTDNIKAIVAYEPGGQLPFPKGQMPEQGKLLNIQGQPEGIEVSREEFLKFTKFPIIAYFGDNIPQDEAEAKKVGYPLNYAWRVRLNIMREWVKLINENGGDAQVVHLPEIGIKGNTHFPFSDLNNADIARLLSEWLKAKGLDK